MKKPVLGLILKISFGLQSAFWVYNTFHFGFISAPNLWWVQILLGLDALLFLLCIWLVEFHRRLIRFGLIAFLATNALLSVTDQLGVLDIAFLSINVLSLLGCLLYFKKEK